MCTTVVLATALTVVDARGAEINYLEDFALADERPDALKQLIPGTDDYYYYNCLHLQNTEQFAKVDALLKTCGSRQNGFSCDSKAQDARRFSVTLMVAKRRLEITKRITTENLSFSKIA